MNTDFIGFLTCVFLREEWLIFFLIIFIFHPNRIWFETQNDNKKGLYCKAIALCLTSPCPQVAPQRRLPSACCLLCYFPSIFCIKLLQYSLYLLLKSLAPLPRSFYLSWCCPLTPIASRCLCSSLVPYPNPVSECRVCRTWAGECEFKLCITECPGRSKTAFYNETHYSSAEASMNTGIRRSR